MQNIYDYVVIGGGLAGLCTAHYLSGSGGKVALVAKSEITDSNSYHAQGGMAAVWSDDDTSREHYEDTMEAGAYLNDPSAVTILTDEAPKRIEELIELGMKFDTAEGKISLGLEGGHHHHRILHAGGDATGQKVTSFMIGVVREDANIDILDHHLFFDLITDDGASRVIGARTIDRDTHKEEDFIARAVVLATGGYGALYAPTTNPQSAKGDGIIAAYRAGATLRDLEFVQFHPTALSAEGAPAFLISEAVRGEGAYLLNRRGKRFMLGRHPLVELAPRDIVAREIFNEMQREGSSSVRLSLRHLDPDRVRMRFPTISEYLSSIGIDMTEEIPVAPAAHYAMGGILADLYGRTTLKGLYTVGEAASTGVMGANRLASNSLVECTVFSKRIAEAVRSDELREPVPATPCVTDFAPGEPDDISGVEERLGNLMSQKVGILRSERELKEALSDVAALRKELENLRSAQAYMQRGRLDLAELVIRSALARDESRGSHYRTDFPEMHPLGEAYHTLVSKDTDLTHIPLL